MDEKTIKKAAQEVVQPSEGKVIEKEVKLQHDGKQYFAKIPTKIAKILDIKNGDKLNFKIFIPAPHKKGKKECTFEIIK